MTSTLVLFIARFVMYGSLYGKWCSGKKEKKKEVYLLRKVKNKPIVVFLCNDWGTRRPTSPFNMHSSPEHEPYCMRHSQHQAFHKLSWVSPKSFTETSLGKTRRPHQLLWKSRDPSGVFSSLKVTCDSLLWLATHPTLGRKVDCNPHPHFMPVYQQKWVEKPKMHSKEYSYKVLEPK